MITSLGLVAEFDVINSSSEFREKIDEYDFSLVCFVDGRSEQGDVIKDHMRALALKGDFGRELRDRFAFLFVPAHKDKLSHVVEKYGYQGEPLFALFEFDQLVVKGDLEGDFSVESMRSFILDAVKEAIEELKDDIKEEKKAKRHEERYRSRPRFHVGFGTGYYPGYGYYHRGRPYWWHRRYYRHPYRHYHRGSGVRVGFGF